MECIYTLMTFGIPSQDVPLDADGGLMTEHHTQWLERRRQSAALSPREKTLRTIIHMPLPTDVLLGRGRSCQEHIGNLRYRLVIDSFQSQYDQARKLKKTQVCAMVVESVHKYKGRFLKHDFVGWIEVDDEMAKDKISHSFRNRRIAAIAASKNNPAPPPPTTVLNDNTMKRPRLPPSGEEVEPTPKQLMISQAFDFFSLSSFRH
jgi:hypothetical protein